MKFTKTTALLIAAAAFVFTGCQEEEIPDSITVSESSLSFSNENAQRVSAEVTANGSWTAESTQRWLHVAPASGDGDASVTIYADDNIAGLGENSPLRTAKITFTRGTATATIEATQDGETIVFSVDGNKPISYTGGILELTVKANESYEVTISDTWIEKATTKAVKEDKLSFTVKENTSFEPRTATITLKPADGDPILQTVNQEGYPREMEKTFTFASVLPYDDVDIVVNSADAPTVVSVSGCKGKTSIKATVKVVDNYVFVTPSGAFDADGMFKFGAEQDGKAVVAYTALAASAAKSVALNPVNAVVTAKFTENDINKVVLEAQDRTDIVCAMKLNYADGTVAPVQSDSAVLNKIVVNAGGEVSVAVAPGTYANGFVFEPYTAQAVSTGAFIDGQTVLAAGDTKAAAAVVKEYTLSDVASLIEMYQQVMIDDTTKNQLVNDMKAWRIHGTTIKLAPGTYEWPGNTKPEFEGFPVPVRFAIDGGSAESTVIKGGAFRMMFVGNQCDVSLNNLTIKEFVNPDGNGGALSIYGYNTTFTANNCVFIDNKVAALKDNGELSSSGGSISFNKSSGFINNCTFNSTDETAHVARNGGAIYTGDDEKSSVVVKNSTFSNFRTYNTGGVANNSKGSQTYEGCTIINTSTQAGCGSAFHMNAANATLNIKDCLIKDCEAYLNSSYATVENKASGTISIQEGMLTLEGTTFENCEGSAASIINVQSGESLNKISNCVFKNCRNASRGLIQVNGKSVTFLDRCLFVDCTTRTNAWGRIVHGGNPATICINNCTVAHHTTPAAGGNSVAVNNDGSILISNSTIVGDFAHSIVRNTNDNSGGNRVTVVNSVLLNENASGKVFKSGHMKSPHTTNHVIFSASDADVYTPDATDVANATVASVGVTFDTGINCWMWDGAAMANKATAAQVEEAMKAFNPTITNKCCKVPEGSSLGAVFYDWIVENGSAAKSYNGADRGSAWWPGSYQK